MKLKRNLFTYFFKEQNPKKIQLTCYLIYFLINFAKRKRTIIFPFPQLISNPLKSFSVLFLHNYLEKISLCRKIRRNTTSIFRKRVSYPARIISVLRGYCHSQARFERTRRILTRPRIIDH